jgi:Spy/CpxP family protein refolding chaperone
MKNARLLVVLALSLTVLCATAFAQPPQQRGGAPGDRPGFGGPGGRGMGLPPEIMKDLSADQRAQVESIQKAAHGKLQELENQSLTQKEFRTQAMQIHKDSRQQMENVLTGDQKARLAQIEASHRGPGGPGGPGRRPGQPQQPNQQN